MSVRFPKESPPRKTFAANRKSHVPLSSNMVQKRRSLDEPVGKYKAERKTRSTKSFWGGMPSIQDLTQLADVDHEISKNAYTGCKPPVALTPDLIAHFERRVKGEEERRNNEANWDGSSTSSECPTHQGLETSAQTSYRLLPVKETKTMAMEATFTEKRTKRREKDELANLPHWQVIGRKIIQGVCFQSLMAMLIICNSIVIGLETDITTYEHWDFVENVFLFCFLGELLVKFVFLGVFDIFNRENPDLTWNLFDTFIVTLGLADFIVGLLTTSKGGSFATLFRIIRLLRILRIIRIVKFLKQLYLLAVGLAEAAQAVFWVTILMTFILYVCAIIMVKTIGRPADTDPNHEFLNRHFGGVLPSMLTMFVLMSSPNLPLYQDQLGLLEDRPLLTLFLISFILFGSFGMLALLTGVISESMFEKNNMRKEEERIEHEKLRMDIGLRCEDMYDSFDKNDDGEVFIEDMKDDDSVFDMAKTFEACGVFVTGYDLCTMIDYLDVDGSGTINKDEFMRGMLVLAEGLRPISVQEVHHDVGVCKVKIERIEAAVESMVVALDGETNQRSGRRGLAHSNTERTLSASHNVLVNISKQIQDLETMQKETCNKFQDLSGQVLEISRQVQTSPGLDIASVKASLSTSFQELGQISRQACDSGQDIASLKAYLSASFQELGQVSRQVQTFVVEDIASLKAYVSSIFQDLGQHITQECERSCASLSWSDGKFGAPLDPSYTWPSSFSATGSPSEQVEEGTSNAVTHRSSEDAMTSTVHPQQTGPADDAVTVGNGSDAAGQGEEVSNQQPPARPRRPAMYPNPHGSDAAGQIGEVSDQRQNIEKLERVLHMVQQEEASQEAPQAAPSKPPAPTPSSAQPAEAVQAAPKLPPLPKSAAADGQVQSSEAAQAAPAKAQRTTQVLKDLHVLQALKSLQSQTRTPLSPSASAPAPEPAEQPSTSRNAK